VNCCDQCGCVIQQGTEYVCVDLHREVISEDQRGRETVTVLEATVLATLCMDCARLLSS